MTREIAERTGRATVTEVIVTSTHATELQHENIRLVAAAPEPHFGYNASKRLIDVIGALLLIIVTLPVAAITSLFIALTSGWPALFGQKRLGFRGEEFRCWKFRTMTRDAELRRDEVLHLNTTGGPTFKHPEDPRLIKLGKFLRQTSIDELPQLWNVLRGDMALVGPRPLPVVENKYRGDQALRLSVKPGLTCTWQVSGRSEISFDQWMEMDLAYVRERSLRKDVVLIGRTVTAVLSRKGAV